MIEKELTFIPRVSKAQIECGRQLGLDLTGCTVTTALAKIEDWLDTSFWGKDPGHPTEKQIALAQHFGYDISDATRRLGSAVISDIMEQLNRKPIEIQGLASGAVVTNKWDKTGMKYTISSIHEGGLVSFKGIGSQRAWARNLVKQPATFAANRKGRPTSK